MQKALDAFQTLLSTFLFSTKYYCGFNIKLVKVLKNSYVTAKGGEIPTLPCTFHSVAAFVFRGCTSH